MKEQQKTSKTLQKSVDNGAVIWYSIKAVSQGRRRASNVLQKLEKSS